MSTLTTTRLVTLPQVNLLPPEIEQERRFRRTQFVLGATVVASLGVVGVLFLAATSQVSSAQGDLADSKRQTTKLEARAAEYSQVPLVYAQVEAARAQLELAMGKEIRWSFYLNDLSLKIPNRMWLDQMTVMTAATGAAAVATAPTGTAGSYIESGIGTVSFEGQALEHNNVAAWLDMLAKQKGYKQAYFTEATKQEVDKVLVVKFKSQVTITEDALSKRYIQKAGS
jgi:Tfp pilus assembly protein PilN